MAAWKPGRGWPSQAKLTYLAALATVVGAVVIVLTRTWEGRGWR